jgi:hypothetical protein
MAIGSLCLWLYLYNQLRSLYPSPHSTTYSPVCHCAPPAMPISLPEIAPSPAPGSPPPDDAYNPRLTSIIPTLLSFVGGRGPIFTRTNPKVGVLQFQTPSSEANCNGPLVSVEACLACGLSQVPVQDGDRHSQSHVLIDDALRQYGRVVRGGDLP